MDMLGLEMTPFTTNIFGIRSPIVILKIPNKENSYLLVCLNGSKLYYCSALLLLSKSEEPFSYRQMTAFSNADFEIRSDVISIEFSKNTEISCLREVSERFFCEQECYTRDIQI